MALNFVQLTRCASFFMANQFRVCARYRLKNTYRHYHRYLPPRYSVVSPTSTLLGSNYARLEKSSIGFHRDYQQMSNSMTIEKPHKIQANVKNIGIKSRSCTELPSLAAKSHKNKKYLSFVKSCTECARKKSDTYRPRPLSLPAAYTTRIPVKDNTIGVKIPRNNLSEVVINVRKSLKPGVESRQWETKTVIRNQFFNEKDKKFISHSNKPIKSGKYTKVSALRRSQSVDEKNLRNTALNEEMIVSLENVTKEMTAWLRLVRKYLVQMKQAQLSQKTKDGAKNRKLSNGAIPLPKYTRKVAKSHSSPTLTDTQNAPKTSEKTSNQKGTNFKHGKRTNTCSYVDNNPEKLNQKISSLTNESNSLKSSSAYPSKKRSEPSEESRKLLEISPKFVENIPQGGTTESNRFVENIPQGPNVGPQKVTGFTDSSNSPQNMVTTQTMLNKNNDKVSDDSQNERGFILLDNPKLYITTNRPELESASTNYCNERGFILIDAKESGGKPSTTRDCQDEKGFIMVDNNIKSDHNLRRSKKEPNNFVLVNDNPISQLRSTQTRAKPNTGSYSKDDVCTISKKDLNERCDVVRDGVLSYTGLQSRKERPNNSKITNQNQGQLIGASDSTEEIHHPCKNTEKREERSSFLERKTEKSDVKDNFLSNSRGLENWSRMVEKTLEDLRSKVPNKTASCESKDVYANDKCTPQGDGAVKGTRQESVVEAKSGENIMKTGWRNSLDSLMGKTSKDKDAKRMISFVDPRVREQPRSVTKSFEAKKVSKAFSSSITNKGSPIKVNTGSPNKVNTGSPNKVNTGSPNKVNTGSSNKFFASRWDSFKRENLKHTKPVAAEVKADYLKRKPEVQKRSVEVSSKHKQFSKAWITWLNSGSRKSSPSFQEKQDQWSKLHLPKNYKSQYEMNKNSDKTIRSTKKQSNVSSVPSTGGSPTFHKSMSLPDLFLQMQRSKTKKTSLSNKNANVPRKKRNTHYNAQKSTSNINAAKTNTENKQRNKELIRELQNQWSQNFQEKYRKFVETSLNNSHFQRNTNCLVGTADTPPVKVLENVRSTPGGTGVHTSPLPSNTFRVYKIEHLKPMGMAERLLSASKPTADIHETGKVPEVKPSDSSMTTFTDATQATTEMDDFPEVDQFEEWVQTNMPEIYKEKSQTSINKGKEIDPPSKSVPPGGFKLSDNDTAQHLRAFEGSSVDERSYSSVINRQSKPITFAEPTAEDTLYYDLSSKDILSNDQHKEEVDTSCLSASSINKNSKRIKPVNKVDSLIWTEPQTDVTKKTQESLKKQQKLQTDSDQATGDVNTITCSFKTEGPCPTLNRSNTLDISSRFESTTMKDSKLFGSIDGFVSMDVVEPPTSPKTLKSNLKKSALQERVEDRKVSFTTKLSDNDNWTQNFGDMDTMYARITNSAADKQKLEGTFAGDRTSRGNDPRKKLEDQRKRAEMEARLKMLNEQSNKIREYEAVLSKYRDIVEKFKVNLATATRDRGKDNRASEV